MTDRNVQYPSRYKLTLVEGTSDVYELTPAPGEVAAEGTILNKANLLTDNTAQALGLTQTDPTVNDALNQLSGKQDPWQLIDLLDNTGSMSGTWTAPDVFGGENYDLGVYMIGGGGSGCARTSAAHMSGGASGYGKNFIINNIAPNSQYAFVIGAGGNGVSGNRDGNAGGATSFNSVDTDGGDGGQQGSNIPAACGGQGADQPNALGVSESIRTDRKLYGCCPTATYNYPGGTSQSPRDGQNMFDTTMVTLSAGGSRASGGATQTIAAMPDGAKGGNAVSGGNGENATGHGNGGGASFNGTSGSGSDGAIYLYARRRSPIEYQVSITVMDQDSNPVDGIAINGLYSNAEGNRNGLAVTGSNGVATGVSYQQQATFTTDAYTDLTSGSVSLVMTEGSVTEGTINVTFTNFVQWTASGTARFSHYVKRIDVSAAGGGGGGGPCIDSGSSYCGGGGGAGGYATQQTDVDFTPDTDYVAQIGAGGKPGKGVNERDPGEDGGPSSFLGVVAQGGQVGQNCSTSSAAVGNGNGAIGWINRSASGQDNSTPPTAGTQQIYDSFTEMKTVGGGGGCGSYNNAPSNGANVGASPNGGKGANKDAAATAAGVAGGGGGTYYQYGSGTIERSRAGSRGGRGEVAIRLYNTHTLPTS